MILEEMIGHRNHRAKIGEIEETEIPGEVVPDHHGIVTARGTGNESREGIVSEVTRRRMHGRRRNLTLGRL
jgi:hypothetical protein